MPIQWATGTSEVVAEYVVRNVPGRPLGGFYGYVAEGVDPETGDMIYKDVSGDGIISASGQVRISVILTPTSPTA